jgi:hypothetical protein
MKTTKTPTLLPITHLRRAYESRTPDVFLFLDSTFTHYLITSDGDEFVALQQQAHGADFTVYEIARADHIDACNAACLRGAYFDVNPHLDAELDPLPVG